VELVMLGVCRSGSVKTIARELVKCKLHLVGEEEVRWDKGGNEWADDYTYFCGSGNDNCHTGTGFFVHEGL